jgi:rod shape determining protein RodA
MALSTVVIYSATYGSKFHGLHRNHLIMFCVFLLMSIGISLIDYRIWVQKYSYVFYGLGILLLIIVMVKGLTINGSKRWINLGFMPFQPSELVKIFVILLLSKLLGKRNGEPLRVISDIVPTFLVVLIPFVMVLIQPDMGLPLCLFAL